MLSWLRQFIAQEPEPRYPCVYAWDGNRLSGGEDATIEAASEAAIRGAVDRMLQRIDSGDGAATVVIRRDADWRLIISGHGRRRYAACLLEEQVAVSHWWCGPGMKDEDPYRTPTPVHRDVHGLVCEFMADPVSLAARPVWWEFNPP